MFRVLLIAAAVLFAGVFVNAPTAHGADAEAAIASAARLAGDEKRTRFVIDLDREVDFRIFPLADPYRIIIDLPETRFHLEAGQGEEGRGLVSAYRYGLFAPGKSRIVLDAEGPVKVDKAFVLEADGDQPARMVVDLVESDRQSVLAEIAMSAPEPTPRGSGAPAPNGHEAVAPGQADDPRDVVVVIDPGHGGIDPGAVSRRGTREKDVVLEFSERLRTILEDKGSFTVHLTRDEDIFIPLAERVRIARRHKASLFISVHADSVARGNVSGATVYTLSDRASDSVAAALAEQENRSDAIAGIDLAEEPDEVADILIDLVRRETKNYSVFFARSLIEGLQRDVSMVKNPHRYAGFRVLRAHDVPSVLLELGYLTNSSDEKHLTNEEWQEMVARRVGEAVKSYFGEKQAHGRF